VAVGAEGSGTRVLALALLAANGVGTADFVAVAAPGDAAAEPRCAGGVEAVFVVNARPTPLIQSLLRDPSMRLVDFAPRAEAYLAAFPYLSAANLPAGGVSLAEDIPSAGAVLLAPAAQLVARADIHPKLVNLLMPMLPELHGGRQLFSPAGRFPSPRLLDYPLHPDAERWFAKGPSLLQRWLPFWVAVWVERMLVLLIPLATLAIPLLRFAPPALRWQVERRIYRWYRTLRELEQRAHAATTLGERAELRAALAGVEAAVAAIRVPAAYGRQLYDLRQHVAFLRGLLAEPAVPPGDVPPQRAPAQARDD